MFLCLSQSTVSRCVREVATAMSAKLLKKWIKFPTDPEELSKIKKGFYDMSRMPGVIGAIDCTHIALFGVNQFKYNEIDFVNRKGYHSINTQIVCDASFKILNMNACYPGATHDSFIWRHSKLRQAFLNGVLASDGNSWLIGDSGYGLEPFLLTPVQDAAEGSPEAAYNAAQILARSTVERCIGILKARFRCLLKERVLHYEPDISSKIISSCIILHNMCITNDLAFEPEHNDGSGLEIFNTGVSPQSPSQTPASNNRDRLIRSRFQ